MDNAKRYGYGRYSLSDVERDGQRQRLEASECAEVLVEKSVPVPYRKHQRLSDYILCVPPRGTLVATSLDRLVQSVDELLMLLADLRERQIKLELLDYRNEPDGATDSSSGISLSALADLERNIRGERRQLGILKAKKNGKFNGRPASFDRKQAAKLYEQGETVAALADRFNVTTRTIYRALSKFGC